MAMFGLYYQLGKAFSAQMNSGRTPASVLGTVVCFREGELGGGGS